MLNACLILKNSTVPALVFIEIFLPSPPSFSGIKMVDSPKSITFMGLCSALVKSRKFSGFKSRWQILFEWQ